MSGRPEHSPPRRKISWIFDNILPENLNQSLNWSYELAFASGYFRYSDDTVGAKVQLAYSSAKCCANSKKISVSYFSNRKFTEEEPIKKCFGVNASRPVDRLIRAWVEVNSPYVRPLTKPSKSPLPLVPGHPTCEKAPSSPIVSISPSLPPCLARLNDWNARWIFFLSQTLAACLFRYTKARHVILYSPSWSLCRYRYRRQLGNPVGFRDVARPWSWSSHPTCMLVRGGLPVWSYM